MRRFKPDLMEAAMAWSQGAKFGDIVKLVDIYEVRVLVACLWLATSLQAITMSSAEILHFQFTHRQADNSLCLLSVIVVELLWCCLAD